MDNHMGDKVGAIIHKVDELDHRVDDLELHDKKSWLFSRSIMKRGFAILWDSVFFLVTITLILGIVGLGFVGLATLMGGT